MAQSPGNQSSAPEEKKPRKRRKKSDATRDASTLRAATTANLYDFTVDFFTHFGAPPEMLESNTPHGALRVHLPEALATHFGNDELVLVFQRVEAGSGQQLVAHGSKVFDAMLAWLDRQSATSVRRLPLRHAGSELLLQAVHPRNAGIAGLKLSDSREPIYLFYWRITYRADDKREEIYLVALNETGTTLALGIPSEARSSRKRDNSEGMAWLRTVLEASEPILAPMSEGDAAGESGGETAGIKLPPVTQLVRLAEQARKYVTWHADVRCAKHEGEILPRLYKIANRLTGYYEQQMEELTSAQGSGRRDALEEDLARKIAEEVENHRLRVQLELCGYVLLYTPVAVAEMQITDGKRTAPLRVQMDRFTGVLRRPLCTSCGTELSDAILCRNGHVVCDACLRQCQGCGDTLCASCGVAECPVCGKQNCDQCSRACRACGERACNEHLERCPVCYDDVCFACQEVCAECGVRQCRSHLRADAVLNSDGRTRLICASCAVRCPGCQQYSARMATCALSGQRYCRNCLVTCADCGRTVGPGYYGVQASGRVVCRACVRLCASCGHPAERIAHCTACGDECCENCQGSCHVCGDVFCARHIAQVEDCGHWLCTEHALACHVGHERICPTCNGVTCAICDRHFCRHHSTACTICGKYYCSACVDGDSDVCETCGAFITGRLPVVDLRREPVAASPSVRTLLDGAIWLKATNRDLTLYLGTHKNAAKTLVSVRAKPDGSSYITSRRLTWIDLDHLNAYRRSKQK